MFCLVLATDEQLYEQLFQFETSLQYPPCCLSVWRFPNCKMCLILSLGLNNRFGLKLKLQFSFMPNIKQYLHWISLTLHQKKFLRYMSERKKEFLVSHYRIGVPMILWHFFLNMFYIVWKIGLSRGINSVASINLWRHSYQIRLKFHFLL